MIIEGEARLTGLIALDSTDVETLRQLVKIGRKHDIRFVLPPTDLSTDGVHFAGSEGPSLHEQLLSIVSPYFSNPTDAYSFLENMLPAPSPSIPPDGYTRERPILDQELTMLERLVASFGAANTSEVVLREVTRLRAQHAQWTTEQRQRADRLVSGGGPDDDPLSQTLKGTRP